jgi:hypothetical protein
MAQADFAFADGERVRRADLGGPLEHLRRR